MGGTRPSPTTCSLLLWVLLELGEAGLHRGWVIGAHHIQLGAAMGQNGELICELLAEVHIQQAHPSDRHSSLFSRRVNVAILVCGDCGAGEMNTIGVYWGSRGGTTTTTVHFPILRNFNQW